MYVEAVGQHDAGRVHEIYQQHQANDVHPGNANQADVEKFQNGMRAGLDDGQVAESTQVAAADNSFNPYLTNPMATETSPQALGLVNNPYAVEGGQPVSFNDANSVELAQADVSANPEQGNNPWVIQGGDAGPAAAVEAAPGAGNGYFDRAVENAVNLRDGWNAHHAEMQAVGPNATTADMLNIMQNTMSLSLGMQLATTTVQQADQKLESLVQKGG